MKIGLGIVAGLLVIGLAVWWSMRPAADRFDYAAAFEQPTASPVAAGDVVDVKALAGRTEEEVAALLGAPAQCEKALHSRRCSYAQAPVEIVFIDGRADWMTIRVYDSELPLLPDALARFGLPVSEPAESDLHQSIWREIAGLKEVRLVGDENGVMYVRIKALTP
jgi:hypothetical protein